MSDDWHLVCITRKGVVSILKNLDLRTARETFKRLRPDDRPQQRKFPDCEVCGKNGWQWSGLSSSHGSGDYLDRVEVIGPEGEKLDPWFGVETQVIDMTFLCRCSQSPPPQPIVDTTAFEERALRAAGALR